MEKIRCMLSDSGIDKEFWGEALNTASYIYNRCINSFLVNKTPYEALNHRKPNVKHLRVFSCTAYAHIPKDERSKLENKATKCCFLGYGSVTKGYKMYDVESKSCLLYTSPSPRDKRQSRMPSSA